MSDHGRLVAGRYRLVERIGRGGMGTVWRAEDELLQRHVAVKKLHAQVHLQDDELATLFERTRREARSAARISHPNVVVVHDVVDDEGLPTIVMEYVPSTTLGDLLRQRGPLSPREGARIGRGMIAALRAAHTAGVVHRDVKPANVLLSETGRVVLTDFGIAQSSGTSTLTRTGELIGSMDFLAPERLTGGAPGPEADLWALGATLFQTVEGRSPFRRGTPIETAYAIAAGEVPSAANAGPLAPVIAGLLVREPALRLSAAEAERLLRAPAAETTTSTTATTSTTRTTATATATSRTHEDRRTRPAETTPIDEPRTTRPPDTAVPLRPGRPRGVPLWVTVPVLVGALVAAGVYAAPHFSAPSPGLTTDAPPVLAASSPAVARTPSYSPSPVADGYHLVEEPDLGFAIPVPDGWKRQVSEDGRQFVHVDPTGLVSLRVSSLDFAGPSPLRHFADVEEQTRRNVDGYERLRMQSTRWRGLPAAVWEFTFQGRARPFRAIDLGFGRPGGQEFAIYLSAPSDRWVSCRPIFDTAVAGLRLTT